MRSSALIDDAVYRFGDLIPAADSSAGADSDGLSGCAGTANVKRQPCQ
jgi:hypothetical protein